MNEIIFIVSEPPEGGYAAEALGQSVFTVADTLERTERDGARRGDLSFRRGIAPQIIRLHFVREELIAV